MKIIKHNINKHLRGIPLNKNINHIGLTKYFPSFSKEWKNIIYSYNNNILKNIPLNYFNINKIIKSYFNLYFKNSKFINDKYNIYLNKRRRFLKRILVSNAEIKYTNSKAIVTIYTINKEKKTLETKYKILNRIIRKKLINRFITIYKHLPSKINYLISKRLNKKYIFIKSILNKNDLLIYKFNYLNKLTKLNYFYIKKIWTAIELKYLEKRNIITNKKILLSRKKLGLNIKKYILLLRRYQLLYTLNKYKFNKSNFLPLLSNLLTKITGKKIEYNVINLKSITHNSDIFTYLLSLKIKKQKTSINSASLSPILHNPEIIKEKNTLLENTPLVKSNKLDSFSEKFKDLKLISNLSNNNLDILLNDAYKSDKNLYNTIYNNIKYKNIGGIKLELNGRLTKRYRADRAKTFTRIKGGFKDKDSSYKRKSTFLFRGNTKSNQSYSIQTSKRRIGSFAVKGWISGK